MERAAGFRWPILMSYLLVTLLGLVIIYPNLGMDIFPPVDTGQFQLRLRAPTGTRVERTEIIALKTLEAIGAEAGPESVDITLGYVGTQPPSYPVNTIHLWTSGPHEAVLLVALRRGSGIRLEEFKERMRGRLAEAIPDTAVSFEAGDVVSQIMNFGAPTPIEVAVSGPNLAADRSHAEKVMQELKTIPLLRDPQFGQPLDYPTLDIKVDRVRAGQLGVTVEQVGRSLVAATSSSRFVQPNYWRDPTTGIAYQVQVEVPQARMSSLEDIESIPAMPSGAQRPLVGDVAQVGYGTMPGEFDRHNQRRMITISANLGRTDLGSAARQVDAAIRRAGQPPRGVTVNLRGRSRQ